MTEKTGFHPKYSIQRGLDALTRDLDEVLTIWSTAANQIEDWTTVLRELDKLRDRPTRIDRGDVQSQLRMFTERLGNLGHPFDNSNRMVTSHGQEIRTWRNHVAHSDGSSLTAADAYRFHDTCVRFLELLGAWEGMEAAEKRRAEAFKAMLPEASTLEPAPLTSPSPTQTLDAQPRAATGLIKPAESQPNPALGRATHTVRFSNVTARMSKSGNEMVVFSMLSDTGQMFTYFQVVNSDWGFTWFAKFIDAMGIDVPTPVADIDELGALAARILAETEGKQYRVEVEPQGDFNNYTMLGPVMQTAE